MRQVACGICATSASHAWSPAALLARISGIASRRSSPLPSATLRGHSLSLSSGPLPDSSLPSLCLVRAAASLVTSPWMRVAFRKGEWKAAKAAALRINLNVEGCGIAAAPVHAPSRAPLLLPLLPSHNLSFPRVH
jgi:hypothetical protein